MKITLFLLISLLATDSAFAFGKKRNPPPAPTPVPTPLPTAEKGSLPTVAYEYKLPASIDEQVLPGVATEIWGKIHIPFRIRPHNPRFGDIEREAMPSRPVIVLLHGNHETCSDMALENTQRSCEYTYTGSCTAPLQPVQNHLGYDYFAQKLASFGFVVVSVNANRGITCGQPVAGDNGLNLARGRLVLRHLAKLRQWNVSGQPATVKLSLKGALDLSQVGLLGHSRGGEGVRAAYNLYHDAGSPWPSIIGASVGFKGIFEIGPTDGQTNRTLDANGVAWNVLLPMCDGDVANMQGMRPFDRMITSGNESAAKPKSMFAVWGANHNFYNTIWNTSDSPGCSWPQNQLWAANGGSPGQQTTAIQSILPFFRGHVGTKADPILSKIFEPSTSVPEEITNVTRIDRAYIATSSTNQFTRLSARFNEGQNVTFTLQSDVKEHLVKATKISWNAASSANYYQEKWAEPGQGYESSAIRALSFRVSRTESSLNNTQNSSFQLRLIYADGTLSSSASISGYTVLTGPIGIPGNLHQVLQTVRLPLAAFGVLPFHNKYIRGIRFVFNQTTSGEINVSDLAFDHTGPIAEPGIPGGRIAGDFGGFGNSGGRSSLASLSGRTLSFTSSRFTLLSGISRFFLPTPTVSPDRVVRVTRVSASSSSGRTAGGDVFEVEMESARHFPVRDALPVLTFNGKALGLGRVPTNGNLRRMIFTVLVSEVSKLPSSFEMGVAHVEDMAHPVREYGTYYRSSLFAM